MPLRLHLEPWHEIDGQIELAATLALPSEQRRLWWRVPAAWADSLTNFADPFVVGLAFDMMEAGQDVEVDAPVSPSLLAYLESFMDVWHMWAPTKYRRVRVFSSTEVEPSEPSQPSQFVMPFSCGVDSCFTAYRHRWHLADRNTKDVALGVTMFGFDIRHGQKNADPMYRELARSAGEMLASLGMAHVEITTNFRQLPSLWMHSHGTQLASGLRLFGKRFGGALVPNSLPVNQLSTIWGSHPFTDPMQSSSRFLITDDGGAVARWEKIAAIADWREAMNGLRVCFGVEGTIGNCGKCEKCIRTALAFKVIGRTPAANLPSDIQAKQFRGIKLKHELAVGFWRDLLDGVNAKGKQDEPWAAGVRRVLRRATRMRITKNAKQPFVPLRNKIREIFRGSAMSKKERMAGKSAKK
jgi:hypothetical protein